MNSKSDHAQLILNPFFIYRLGSMRGSIAKTSATIPSYRIDRAQHRGNDYDRQFDHRFISG